MAANPKKQNKLVKFDKEIIENLKIFLSNWSLFDVSFTIEQLLKMRM